MERKFAALGNVVVVRSELNVCATKDQEFINCVSSGLMDATYVELRMERNFAAQGNFVSVRNQLNVLTIESQEFLKDVSSGLMDATNAQ